ncbi:hypothetical protein EGW08_013225, partial [Elysia chlorotica]
MFLSPHNVWTADARVFERKEGSEGVVEANLKIKSDCFMSGSLQTQDGVASFSHCNGLSGFIQTPDLEYIIEQAYRVDGEPSMDWEFPEVTVTLFRTSANNFGDSLKLPDDFPTNKGRGKEENDNAEKEDDDTKSQSESVEDEDISHLMEDEGLFFNQTQSESESESKSESESESKDSEDEDINPLMEEESLFFNQTDSLNGTVDKLQRINKRATPSPIAAEIAVYVARSFADYLRTRGINTLQKITEFMITKWNAVARVYGEVQNVGVPFDIQLKRIEVWWQNPAFYIPVQRDQSMGQHLNVFCDNTRTQPADHRML